ncbi:MAG: hypothetical protein Q9N67_04500 [Ghiorsea sp.]|nr:hypothetical protein [Ghiorsea sp.]
MLLYRLSFVVFMVMLLFARSSGQGGYSADKVVFTTSVFDTATLQVVAGPLPGLVADFKLLNVFSLFNEMQKHPQSDYGTYIYEDLTYASDLDPKFHDVYRLASSILAFDANMPEEAVMLLEKGTYSMPSRWDTPFLGGFIAFEQVGDAQKAFELMNLAATREDAPPFTALLAARYLRNESTVEETISFLQSLVQMMPEDYRAGILSRIDELKKEVK